MVVGRRSEGGPREVQKVAHGGRKGGPLGGFDGGPLGGLEGGLDGGLSPPSPVVMLYREAKVVMMVV